MVERNLRLATFCDCGNHLVGFANGILVCDCGLAFSVSRLPLGKLTAAVNGNPTVTATSSAAHPGLLARLKGALRPSRAADAS